MSPAHRGLLELPGLEKSSDLGVQYSLWTHSSARGGAQAGIFWDRDTRQSSVKSAEEKMLIINTGCHGAGLAVGQV